ncbi:MAG: hypothetical protein ABI548_02810 [Polyangiaceae bacterium]
MDLFDRIPKTSGLPPLWRRIRIDLVPDLVLNGARVDPQLGDIAYLYDPRTKEQATVNIVKVYGPGPRWQVEVINCPNPAYPVVGRMSTFFWQGDRIFMWQQR